jgi:hypothetical protein
MFGLSVNPPQVIIDGNDPGVDGINNPDGANDASVEAYLDVEWAGAVAPWGHHRSGHCRRHGAGKRAGFWPPNTRCTATLRPSSA